ncbi:ribosome maturation factor RimM [Alsobacter sp. SYSU M60028]|uniref:Ribosome maturation factor RimM n=1 Tax=Alsobacter ponti TaxID=2962936 RepID=A0ABT1LD90_9HYPH|nr:ribosome maturation factor RimM [Alsobacter ponti]MCP8938690.1 ribosome maturation factor RimM [Alsobacter ponti]
MPSDLILVGVFGAPHGVRGELRLKSYTDDPLAIAGYGRLADSAGKRQFVLASARLVKDDMLVVRVEGVNDREAAAALTNVKLHVPRARLPEPEDEEEFYRADLIGLRVEDEDGALLGTIGAVLDFGAGDILEMLPVDGGRPVMLPFSKSVVPVVDVRGGRIVARPPVLVQEEEAGDDEAGPAA